MPRHPLIYVQESLTDNEDIVDAAFYHWMFMVNAAFWMFVFIVIAISLMLVGAVYYHYPDLPPTRIMEAMGVLQFQHFADGFWRSHIIFRVVSFGFLMIGLTQFASAVVIRATSEMAVTDRRVIYKRGLVARKVADMRVENVESVDVNQTILGRIFHYAGIEIKGTGVGDIKLPKYTANAVNFRKSIQMARDLRMEE